MKILSELLKKIQCDDIQGNTQIEISDITYNSKNLLPHSLFVGISGTHADGKKYVPDAVANGAVAVVFEGEFFDNLSCTQIRVSGARAALARLSSVWFDNPSASLYLAGVTGTNGKTTLTYLAEALWQRAGFKTGVVGTVNVRFADILSVATQTTPESRDLQEIFLVRWVTMLRR
jgi:UDP-N-acetylmuramoyl-L-alanyl-D-glutamate--2,6-diaminopimelate ligase